MSTDWQTNYGMLKRSRSFNAGLSGTASTYMVEREREVMKLHGTVQAARPIGSERVGHAFLHLTHVKVSDSTPGGELRLPIRNSKAGSLSPPAPCRSSRPQKISEP